MKPNSFVMARFTEVWEKERCILRLDPRLDPAHR
jgi:hypothetical protein